MTMLKEKLTTAPVLCISQWHRSRGKMMGSFTQLRTPERNRARDFGRYMGPLWTVCDRGD
jgi:hypothetical protein